MAEEKKDVIDRPDWNLDEDGQEVDRTTGAYHGAESEGKFTTDKKGVPYYTGSLNELDEYVERELGKEEAPSQQVAIAEQLDTTERGNTVLPEWDGVSAEARRLFSPDELSTLDDEAAGVVAVLGTAGYEQVSEAIDSLPKEVSNVVLKTISAGVEELGSAKGAHEAILRALRSESDRELWLDAVERFPQILQDAIDGE